MSDDRPRRLGDYRDQLEEISDRLDELEDQDAGLLDRLLPTR